MGGRFVGRRQVLDHLRASLDELDRRFDARRVEPVGELQAGEESFEIGWRSNYEKAGCPDLVFEGLERATFEADKITLLEDIVEEGADRRIQEYLERYLG